MRRWLLLVLVVVLVGVLIVFGCEVRDSLVVDLLKVVVLGHVSFGTDCCQEMPVMDEVLTSSD